MKNEYETFRGNYIEKPSRRTRTSFMCCMTRSDCPMFSEKPIVGASGTGAVRVLTEYKDWRLVSVLHGTGGKLSDEVSLSRRRVFVV